MRMSWVPSLDLRFRRLVYVIKRAIQLIFVRSGYGSVMAVPITIFQALARLGRLRNPLPPLRRRVGRLWLTHLLSLQRPCSCSRTAR